ncbi:MAG: hypothetical protein LKK50_07840 [Prevotella sp.]|jgi:hypothetical protein|nr:hypothetical protein [Prevotella sp.]MCH3985452.1 hypothetical protein [Prevotella sp.]MCH4017248.1 hypothetical protein [Prevotella sp.]MCI1325176.1 hypothetical protein [Prevotella sp.]MCI1685940.1 hypothetical protein [Prevotella sp.]MCI1781409.1 hypothetical protein [Prevotella sp.]
MKKLILAVFFLTAISLSVMAQSGTNSPYSAYGLGELADQTTGFNRGMNGVALGFREHNQVNYLNPASYSAIDSLSFIFDMGFSGQSTHFREAGKTLNAKNADLEYVVAGFRAFRHLGVSFGMVPFTNVGYDYTLSGNVGNATSTTYTNTYSGSGGVHQVYLGTGWELFKGFSLGANVSYLWGDYDRTISNAYSDSYVNTLTRDYTGTFKNYKLDFGLQYTCKLLKKDWLTVGLIYTPGHSIGGEPKVIVTSTNSQTSVAEADTLGGKSLHLSIPDMFGAGLTWNHNNQLKIGFDYTLQKWGKLDYPELEDNDQSQSSYVLKSGILKDRQKVTLGGEYCHGEYDRHFLGRLRYRAGFSYATPYTTINGANGPKEYSASFGFGIPIVNSLNNRSFLNISAQWVHRSASGMINENTFRINIGITFNERWFQKFKVE